MSKQGKSMEQGGSQNNQLKIDIIGGILLAVVVCIMIVGVYKAQLADVWDKKVTCTLMLEHKETDETLLFKQQPSIAETFFCTVPNLQSLKVQCSGEAFSEETRLLITLKDSETQEEYYHMEDKAALIVKNGKEFVRIHLDKETREKIGNTENRYFTLTWTLLKPQDTMLVLTSDYKPGIVDNVNGDITDKSNIIYEIQYADCQQLKQLYFLLGAALLVFILTAYILLIVKRVSVYRAYIPLTFMLGMIFNFVIMVHGVPDEPWHIDTAYKYSNQLLFVGDTGNSDTLYKRQCDVVMSDMLANGVESNSYYQMLHHIFERPGNTKLQEVEYTDTAGVVNRLVFLPAAVGISIGRLFGLSSILTIMLGRSANLLFFVLVTGWAIRIIPKGKYVLAAIGMLPISMQQAAAISYDPVITSVIFLFIAYCFYLQDGKLGKRQMVFLVLLMLFIVSLKGGVYAFVCLLVIIPLWKQYRQSISMQSKGTDTAKADWKESQKKKVLYIIIGIAVVSLGGAVLMLKFYPVIKNLLTSDPAAGTDALYSLGYLLKHPAKGLYLYWTTIVSKGDIYIRGVLGGILAWHDIKISWTYIILLLFGLCLLSNIQTDCNYSTKRQKIMMLGICIASVSAIMLSMLFACTNLTDKWIQGVQGRYFLPLLPLLMIIMTSRMIRVECQRANVIWMGMLLTEVMIVLQFLVLL